MLDAGDFMVRLRTQEEQARYRFDNAPVYFTCPICCCDKQEERNTLTSSPSPFPGNICRACADRHGRSWGLNTNWRTSNRRDFHHMRALSAITHALAEETRNARA
jgi:hypothetical protein